MSKSKEMQSNHLCYAKEQLGKACGYSPDTTLLKVSVEGIIGHYSSSRYVNKDMKGTGDPVFLITALKKGLRALESHSKKGTSRTIGFVLWMGVTHIMDELDSRY